MRLTSSGRPLTMMAFQPSMVSTWTGPTRRPPSVPSPGAGGRVMEGPVVLLGEGGPGGADGGVEGAGWFGFCWSAAASSSPAPAGQAGRRGAPGAASSCTAWRRRRSSFSRVPDVWTSPTPFSERGLSRAWTSWAAPRTGASFPSMDTRFASGSTRSRGESPPATGRRYSRAPSAALRDCNCPSAARSRLASNSAALTFQRFTFWRTGAGDAWDGVGGDGGDVCRA